MKQLILCLHIPSEVPKKKDLLSQKYKNSTPIAIFVSKNLKLKCLRYDHFGASLFSLILSPHLQDNYPTVIAPIIGHY